MTENFRNCKCIYVRCYIISRYFKPDYAVNLSADRQAKNLDRIMTSTHKPPHPRYSARPPLLEILFNIIFVHMNYGTGIPTHSEKQSSSCWFRKYKGKMNQGLFSHHTKIPPTVNQPCPLYLPQSNCTDGFLWRGCQSVIYTLFMYV